VKLPYLALGLAAMLGPAAFGQADLGGNGVWFPRRIPDLARGVPVPFLPAAQAQFEANQRAKQNPNDARCLPPGVPRIVLTPEPFQIVEQPNRILFLYEAGAHVWRNIWMDGRPHPKDPNPSWLGDSIGHWEGKTLVVDSVGFNDKTWLDDAGHPHTEQLHVIERFTRTSPSSMKYEVTIEDPGAYSKPWTASATIPFRQGERLQEFICLEGERRGR